MKEKKFQTLIGTVKSFWGDPPPGGTLRFQTLIGTVKSKVYSIAPEIAFEGFKPS
ncbi:uncharacterized protein TTMY_1407 [Thermus thermophilus]|nr:uncharacterized protein TTMY_1407 [Thermus thermophilus]